MCAVTKNLCEQSSLFSKKEFASVSAGGTKCGLADEQQMVNASKGEKQEHTTDEPIRAFFQGERYRCFSWHVVE